MSEVYKCQYLTGTRLTVFLALADAIIPPDDDSPGAGSLVTAGIVDWALARIPEALRGRLLAFLLGVNYLGIFFGGRTFVKNGPAARARELKFLESAPLGVLRLGFFGLKSYICMGYYTREEVWKTIGYEGPLVPDRPYPDPVIRALCQGRVEVSA